MAGAGRGLLLALAAFVAAVGLAVAGGRAYAADLKDPQRQVLVMLRLPPEHVRANAAYGGGYGDGMGKSARRRIVARLARTHGLSLVDEWPMPLAGVDCFVLAAPAETSTEALAAALSLEPGVLWSEPMNLYRAQGGRAHVATVDDDPLFAVQPAAREWRLAELHQVATGRGVHVAVIDSMIEATHPDLVGQVETAQNFVAGRAASPEQHGTNVAGIIAARANNGVGIAGVAPRARLMALRACWQQSAPPGKPLVTLCDSLSLAKALTFAINHNAQVINLSLSGPPNVLLGKLLDTAEGRHITVVGAFDRDLPNGGFPASHAGVVAVADEASGALPAGVYGAPGRDAPTTQLGGRWSLVSGSSIAAAHVSGLFALLREHAASPTRSLASLAVRPGGGVVDACMTILHGPKPCDSVAAGARDASAIVRR
jgi:hypothetical protein